MKIVCPQEPGSKCEMKMDLLNAFKELLEKKEQLEALVFLFSGHHSAEYGFQLGSDEEFITKEELLKQMKALKPYVKKFLVFLDCCSAEMFTELNDDKCILIQLNACGEREKSIIETDGSIVTKYIIQAFTREARNVPCLLEGITHNCNLFGNFFTIQSLYEYIQEHVKEHLKMNKKLASFQPLFSAVAVDKQTSVVAYRYNFKVELQFYLPFTFNQLDPVPICPHEFQDMEGLQYIMFKRVVGKIYLTISKFR